MLKRRTIITAAILTPALGLALAGLTGLGRLDDSAAVKKNTADFQTAWNKHDPKALAALWAKDGDLVDPWGVVSTGSAEVEKFFAHEHTGSGPLAKSTAEVKKDSVRFITPDVALSDWEVVITGLTRPDGTVEGPMSHRVVIVSKKEGSAWKFAAARPGIPQPAEAKPMPKPAK
jgi:uncharacterized protein (TIGR02246 family)